MKPHHSWFWSLQQRPVRSLWPTWMVTVAITLVSSSSMNRSMVVWLPGKTYTVDRIVDRKAENAQRRERGMDAEHTLLGRKHFLFSDVPAWNTMKCLLSFVPLFSRGTLAHCGLDRSWRMQPSSQSPWGTPRLIFCLARGLRIPHDQSVIIMAAETLHKRQCVDDTLTVGVVASSAVRWELNSVEETHSHAAGVAMMGGGFMTESWPSLNAK